MHRFEPASPVPEQLVIGLELVLGPAQVFVVAAAGVGVVVADAFGLDTAESTNRPFA